MKYPLAVIIHTLILPLFSFSVSAQHYINIDSINTELQKKLGGIHACELATLNDSILILKWHERSPIHSEGLRGAIDSTNYEVYFIFRQEVPRQAYYNQAFDSLMHKYKINAPKIPFLTFHRCYPDFFQSLLPYTIPTSIVHPNFSIIILDNDPEYPDYVSTPKEYFAFELLYNRLADGAICNLYGSKISFPETLMLHEAGIFSWGDLRKYNYPHLYNE